MLKPAYVDGKSIIFGAPGQTIFSNANVDAIANLLTSTNIFPYAYSASLQSQYDEHNFRTTAIDVDITALSRVAFGVFLADSALGNQARENIIYSCRGSLKFYSAAQGYVHAYPIFGRCNAGTITSTLVANANQLSKYIKLPIHTYHQYGGASSRPTPSGGGQSKTPTLPPRKACACPASFSATRQQ